MEKLDDSAVKSHFLRVPVYNQVNARRIFYRAAAEIYRENFALRGGRTLRLQLSDSEEVHSSETLNFVKSSVCPDRACQWVRNITV